LKKIIEEKGSLQL